MSESRESEFQALEQALSQLKPIAVTLPRDRLLFEAGQASLTGKLRRWRWLCGMFAVLTLGLSIGLISRWSVEPTVRYIQVPRPAQTEEKAPLEVVNPPATVPIQPQAVPGEASLSSNSVWQLQQQMLRTGEMPMPVQEAAEPEPIAPTSIPAVRDWQTSKSSGLFVKQ